MEKVPFCLYHARTIGHSSVNLVNTTVYVWSGVGWVSVFICVIKLTFLRTRFVKYIFVLLL